jgi:hypothetical protein
MMFEPKHKGIFAFIAIILLLIGMGYLITSSSKSNPNDEGASQEVTLDGKTICLPHKDTSGPQTLECAFGIKTGEGDNYALDLSALSPENQLEINTGEEIQVIGIVVPIEAISSDTWQKYDVKGIMQVSTGNAE